MEIEKYPEISEKEYEMAVWISGLSLYSKDLKEIADIMGKTPKETRDYYMDMVKAYNGRRYLPKPAQPPAEKKSHETKSAGNPSWEGKTGNSLPKILMIAASVVLLLAVVVYVSFEAGKDAGKEVKDSGSTSQRFDIKKREGNIVASKNSDVYHLISCDYVENIKEENRIYFKTTTEAQASGLKQCEVCFFTERNTPVNTPRNGEIITYPNEECIAPLTIETRGDKDYYIVLKGETGSGTFTRMTTGEIIGKKYDDIEISFYVRGGQTAKIEVPLGEYEIWYTTGEKWYGKKHKFGPQASYYKCNDYFDFYEENGYVSGWTLELYLQNNGNLSTDLVDAEDFPDI